MTEEELKMVLMLLAGNQQGYTPMHSMPMSNQHMASPSGMMPYSQIPGYQDMMFKDYMPMLNTDQKGDRSKTAQGYSPGVVNTSYVFNFTTNNGNPGSKQGTTYLELNSLGQDPAYKRMFQPRLNGQSTDNAAPYAGMMPSERSQYDSYAGMGPGNTYTGSGKNAPGYRGNGGYASRGPGYAGARGGGRGGGAGASGGGSSGGGGK